MSLTGQNADLRSRVAEFFATEVRRTLQMDGGDVELLDITDGIVRVRVHGTCGGCPSTVMAVLMGIDEGWEST